MHGVLVMAAYLLDGLVRWERLVYIHCNDSGMIMIFQFDFS
jgi:hypothetical protein